METVTADDVRELCARTFTRAGVEVSESDDGSALVIPGADDEAILIAVVEAAEASDATSTAAPAIIVTIALFDDVETSSISSADVASINNDLMFGKVALNDGELELQHELLGWPGSAELIGTVEHLVASCGEARDALQDAVKGSLPAPYSELVGD